MMLISTLANFINPRLFLLLWDMTHSIEGPTVNLNSCMHRCVLSILNSIIVSSYMKVINSNSVFSENRNTSNILHIQFHFSPRSLNPGQPIKCQVHLVSSLIYIIHPHHLMLPWLMYLTKITLRVTHPPTYISLSVLIVLNFSPSIYLILC